MSSELKELIFVSYILTIEDMQRYQDFLLIPSTGAYTSSKPRKEKHHVGNRQRKRNEDGRN